MALPERIIDDLPKRVRIVADGRAGKVDLVYYDRLHSGDSYDVLEVSLDDGTRVRGPANLFEGIDQQEAGTTMDDRTNDGMAFQAKQLSMMIMARHQRRFSVAEILVWADRCTEKYPKISLDPAWWLDSACADVDCLDAAVVGLSNATGKPEVE